MSEQTPETFDLAGFISGATRPKRSVTVYGDGDRLAELDRIGELVKAEKSMPQASEGQRAIGEKSPRQQYAELWEQIKANSFEIQIKSHTRDEHNRIVGDREVAKDKTGDVERDVYLDLVADAMVPSVPRAQLEELVAVIGEYQWRKIVVAYTKAFIGAPEPSADFLPRASTQAGGDSSSRH